MNREQSRDKKDGPAMDFRAYISEGVATGVSFQAPRDEAGDANLNISQIQNKSGDVSNWGEKPVSYEESPGRNLQAAMRRTPKESKLSQQLGEFNFIRGKTEQNTKISKIKSKNSLACQSGSQ